MNDQRYAPIVVAKFTQLQLQHLQLFADLHLEHLRVLQHFATVIRAGRPVP
ncbi:MAG: hypothetical protein JNM70_16240 [Anaerolineae bacterium]|nr:hypothetical protein [Anaerolineae bacterium]